MMTDIVVTLVSMTLIGALALTRGRLAAMRTIPGEAGTTVRRGGTK
jgi:hypothetical protein